MLAIASLLNTFPKENSGYLWKSLISQCEMAGVQLAPLPHFSWHVSENYKLDDVENILYELSKTLTPFIIKTTGLGIFTGSEPVIYFPIVKTRKLLEIHEQLWDRLSSCSTGISPFYSINQWIPHITLISDLTTPQKIGCAISDLCALSFEIELLVNNIALIYKIDNHSGIMSKFQLLST